MSLLSRHARLRGTLKSVLAVSVALGFLATAVHAQQQQPAAAAQANETSEPQDIKLILAPGQSWTKICGTDPNNVETCVTSGIFIVEKDGGRGITLYAYEVKSNPPQKQVRFMVPLGFQLQRGVRLTLDEKNVFPGRYEVCVPPGCYVGMENGDKLIAAMLKAKNGTLTVQDMRSAAINVSFPLDEFEKAFNGKPVDPEELTRQREKLEQELVKRSDEMRKQLLGEGADENAPAADASPAP